MFKTLVEKKLKKSAVNSGINLLERIAIIRFGSEKAAKEIISGLSINGMLDDEGMKSLMRLMYLDKFIVIFEPLIKVKGFKSLFQELPLIEPRARKVLAGITKEESNILTQYFEKIFNDKTILKILPFQLGKSKRTLKLLEKCSLTSKNKIAKEIGIDKETLNKWLNFYFKGRFDNSRKITLKDYFEIMLKFTLKNAENPKNIKDDIESFNKRLETDLVHNRNTLLKDERLEGLHEKSLKENLRKQELDSDMKKIPFSLKEDIIEKLT